MSDTMNWTETLRGTRPYTFDDVLRVREDAARMQSEAVSRHLAWIGGGAWRALKWFGRGLYGLAEAGVNGVTALRLFEELNGLSDRELADRGLTRDDISRYVLAALDGHKVPQGLYAIDGDKAAESASPSTQMPSRRAA